MKAYLQQILFFLLLCLTCIVGLFFIVKAVFEKHNPFVFENNINKIILGHSHAEAALDDHILTNTVNLAHSADGFFYSYVKLKESLKYNDNIDTLILAFTPTDISDNDARWTMDKAHLSSRLSKYIYFINPEDRKALQSYSKTWLFPLIIKSVPLEFSNLLRDRNRTKLRAQFGGYDPKKTVLLKNREESLNAAVHVDNEMSKLDDEYLRRIILLCKESGINLILLNPPKFNDNRKDAVKQAFETYRKDYSNEMTLIDCSSLVMPNGSYGDGTHLNDVGGEYFSNLIEQQGWKNLKGLCAAYSLSN